jgi:hypothetical protein
MRVVPTLCRREFGWEFSRSCAFRLIARWW